MAGTLRYGMECGIEIVRWQLDAWYDRVHRVDTSGRIAINRLGVESANAQLATWYEPSPNACFRQLLGQLPIEFGQYTFVDYGSGKGRVLFLAADCPFREIIGVEFSPELHRVACRNIATYRSRHQRCRQIKSRCMDAVDFELPAGPLVLFFYSPFRAAVFERILARIEDSARIQPRSIYLLYLGVLPEIINLFDRPGFERREVPLRPDYLRGTKKRGFIIHLDARG